MEEMRTTAFQHNCDDGNDDDDKNSQYRFSLHMTLLYNFELLSGSSALDNGAVSEEVAAQTYLIECREKLVQQLPFSNAMSVGLQLRPKEWLTFDYPKCADNGRGFGAAISLLLVEKDETLLAFQQAVGSVFPVDERQNFTPHLSLVYAPQQALSVLTSKTDQLQKEQVLLNESMRATSLSVWSTRGKIQDWYRVSSINLTSSSKLY